MNNISIIEKRKIRTRLAQIEYICSKDEYLYERFMKIFRKEESDIWRAYRLPELHRAIRKSSLSKERKVEIRQLEKELKEIIGMEFKEVLF